MKHGCRRSQDLEQRLRARFAGNVTQAHLKMAEAPDGAPLPTYSSCCCLKLASGLC